MSEYLGRFEAYNPNWQNNKIGKTISVFKIKPRTSNQLHPFDLKLKQATLALPIKKLVRNNWC